MSSHPTQYTSPRALHRPSQAQVSPYGKQIPTQIEEINDYPIKATADAAGRQRAIRSTPVSNAQQVLPVVNLKPVHTRSYEYKYLFYRPRLLQHYDGGKIVESRGHGTESANEIELGLLRSSSTVKVELSSAVTLTKDVEEKGSTGLAKRGLLEYHHCDDHTGRLNSHPDWLNLFIDLLWGGIISNISENFTSKAFEPSNSWGLVFLEFIVLFLMAFKIWDDLRKFLNNYYNRDYFQSIFIVWIVILALFFGNQAPYFLEPGGSSIIIWTYLVAKYSFSAMEIFSSLFIPSIRRELGLSLILALPGTALWISALRFSWPTSAALALPAIMLDSLTSTLMALPARHRFLRDAPEKFNDPDSHIERLQGFFTIILGEGLVGLIASSNWGLGFGAKVVIGVQATMIYYYLLLLFFTGDSSKNYVHALFRNRYAASLFNSMHVFLYASLLLLDNSIKYLMQNGLAIPKGPANGPRDDSAAADWFRSINRAHWTVSAALSTVLASMTIATLLNRSLDGPGTLFVNNRYIRLAPRIAAIVVLMCLPTKTNIRTGIFFFIIMGLMMSLSFWEHVAGMDKRFRLYEPKNASD